MTTITTTELTSVTGGGNTRALAEQYGFDYDELKKSLGKREAKMAIKADLGGLPKLK
jgi:hypothetical protein